MKSNLWSMTYDKPLSEVEKLKKKAKLPYTRKVKVLKQFYYCWNTVKEVAPFVEFFQGYKNFLTKKQ